MGDGKMIHSDESYYIVTHTTEESLLRQLAEECMELGQACMKMIRCENPDDYVKGSKDEIFNNLVEEIADVKNLMAMYQLKQFIFDGEVEQIRRKKMKRWYERLNSLKK